MVSGEGRSRTDSPFLAKEQYEPLVYQPHNKKPPQSLEREVCVIS